MASVLANRQYNLDFFINLELNHSYTELDDETIQKINKLSKRVGAPSYQKTPVFKRNNYRHQNLLKKEKLQKKIGIVLEILKKQS